MYECELAAGIGFFVDDQVKAGHVILRMQVMVAHHQMHGKGFQVKTPLSEKLVFQVGAGMKKVSYENQFGRPEMLDLLEEPLQIFLIDRWGYGNARTPEMAGLAKMKVRYNEHPF
jgi:hypothetical protein